MKHCLLLITLGVLFPVLVSAQGISQLQQFTSTTSPSSAITQTTFGKALKITGLTTGQCLTLDANGLLTTAGAACGTANFSYLFPSNATTTKLDFNGGLTSLASSTIGAGAQTTGLTVSGGATTTGNAYFAGNVGIGTTSPSRPLSVSGQAYFASSVTIGDSTLQSPAALQIGTSSDPRIQYFRSATNGNKFVFNNAGPSSYMALGVFSTGANTRVSIGYSPTLATTQTEVLSVVDTGNVGIGASSPFSKLTVQGTSGAGIMDLTSGDTTLVDADLIGQYGFRSIDTDGHVGGDQLLGYMAGVIEDNTVGGSFAGSDTEGAGLAFYTSGARPSSNAAFTPAERLRITKTGNVGIGSTTPFSKLSIHAANGETNRTLFAIGSSTATSISTLFSVTNKGQALFSDGTITEPSIAFAAAPGIGFYRTGASSFGTGSSFNIGDGTCASPSIGFNNNGGTGIYRIGTGIFGFCGNGTGPIMRIGLDGMGVGVASTPAGMFHASSSGSQITGVFDSRGTGDILQLRDSGTTVFSVIDGGNAGIGSTTPNAKLSVHAFPNNTNSTLLAVASSTASATTTVLSTTNGGQTSTCETVFGNTANGATYASSTAMSLSFKNTCNQILIQHGFSATTLTVTDARIGDTKRIIVANPGGTAGALTWSGVVWFGGTTPTQTTTANSGDMYSCIVTQATSTTIASNKVICGPATGIQ